MINQLVLAILFTLAPILELRAGMPVAIDYAIKNNISLIPIILLIILVNIFVIFFIFWFLDTFHHKLIKLKFYKRFYEMYLRKIQKKVDKFEAKYEAYGMLALCLFVAIPLPGTGAWTGSIIAWILDLERKPSLIAISIGVIIAGILISLASLGILTIFNSI